LVWHGNAILFAERKGQRREPAADDVRFVPEPIGWLPFAAPPGWNFVLGMASKIALLIFSSSLLPYENATQ